VYVSVCAVIPLGIYILGLRAATEKLQYTESMEHAHNIIKFKKFMIHYLSLWRRLAQGSSSFPSSGGAVVHNIIQM
jgi:hypothetical protein